MKTNKSNKNNTDNQKSNKSNNQKSTMQKFISIVLAIVLGYMLVFVPLFIININNEEPEVVTTETSSNNTTERNTNNEKIGVDDPPKKTVFTVLGVDESEMLTDIMLLCCYDSEFNKLTVISIPRDTLTELSDEEQQYIYEMTGYYAMQGPIKMNWIHSSVGSEYGPEVLNMHLENIFGIEIDYWFRINIDAFVEIVDVLGGVWVDVPQNMYYVDPYQDLYIDLQAGYQHLTGEEAMGFVRYRKTSDPSKAESLNGDIERFENLQIMIDALMEQCFTSENIKENWKEIAKIVYQNVDTNFPIKDAPKYVKEITEFNYNSIEYYQIPGGSGMVYIPSVGADQSVFLYDVDETQELMNYVFYDIPSDTYGSGEVEEAYVEPLPVEPHYLSLYTTDPHTLNVQILNGTGVEGMGEEAANKFIEYQYTVVSVEDYTGELVPQTRIIVDDKSNYESFAQYFEDPSIIIDPNMPQEYDVIIILGQNLVTTEE